MTDNSEIKHVKMYDVEIGTTSGTVTENINTSSCGFRYGKCMRSCCGSGKLSFCELCRSKDCNLRDPCTLTGGAGAACTMSSLCLSVVGVCCCAAEYCCARRPNQHQFSTCNLCGLILYVWQALLFIASWFMGIGVFLFVVCITIFLVRRYGVACCTRCGCKDCADGFAEEIV